MPFPNPNIGDDVLYVSNDGVTLFPAVITSFDEEAVTSLTVSPPGAAPFTVVGSVHDETRSAGGSWSFQQLAFSDAAGGTPAAGFNAVSCSVDVAAGGIEREAAAVVATSAIGGLVRDTGTVTVTTAEPHGFESGETATLDPGEDGFAAGDYVVTKVNATSFTYEDAGDDGASEAEQSFLAARAVTVTAPGHGFAEGDTVTLDPGEAEFAADDYEVVTATADTFTYRDPAGAAETVSEDTQTFSDNRTLDLPPAADAPGQRFTIKKVDASANTVAVVADGTDEIEGANPVTLTAQWDYVSIISNGVDTWLIDGSVVTP